MGEVMGAMHGTVKAWEASEHKSVRQSPDARLASLDLFLSSDHGPENFYYYIITFQFLQSEI